MPSSASAPRIGLHTRIGLPTATAIVVGNMVGFGVFTSLGWQLLSFSSGFVLLMLWVAGGLYALMGAVCNAELAAAFPRSGGEYHLLGKVFHPAVGFVSGWLSVSVGFAAPIALAATVFAGNLTGALGSDSPIVSAALACGVIVFVSAFHVGTLKVGGAFQNVFTSLKLVLIVVLIGSAFALAPAQPLSFLPGEGDFGALLGGSFAFNLIFVTLAYSGWNAAVYIADEIEDPERNVLRALVIGTLIVTALYVLLNAAFLHSAPIDALRKDPGNEHQPEVSLIAATYIFGEVGGRLMGLLISLGLVSSISAMVWAGPRVALTMGTDYPALRWLARTSEAGIPVTAIVLQAVIAMSFVLLAPFLAVWVFVELAFLLSLSATVAGVIWLRIREPELPRPYRAWGYPATPIVFLAMNVFIIANTLRDPDQLATVISSFAVLAVGALLYPLVRARS